MGMVSSCKQTPNMDPPKGLSIAHWKALGESYLLSHKSSSGGGSMKELWPLEENKYIFLFYGETVPSLSLMLPQKCDYSHHTYFSPPSSVIEKIRMACENIKLMFISDSLHYNFACS